MILRFALANHCAEFTNSVFGSHYGCEFLSDIVAFYILRDYFEVTD